MDWVIPGSPEAYEPQWVLDTLRTFEEAATEAMAVQAVEELQHLASHECNGCVEPAAVPMTSSPTSVSSPS